MVLPQAYLPNERGLLLLQIPLLSSGDVVLGLVRLLQCLDSALLGALNKRIDFSRLCCCKYTRRLNVNER